MNEQTKYPTVSAGTACFLVKDERLRQGWNCPIYAWLQQHGFSSWGRKGRFGLPFVFINPNSKLYAPGMPGVSIAEPVGRHAVTWDEFLTVYGIFQKYAGLDPLVMTKQEQQARDMQLLHDRAQRVLQAEQNAAYFAAATYGQYCRAVYALLLRRLSAAQADAAVQESAWLLEKYYREQHSPDAAAAAAEFAWSV